MTTEALPRVELFSREGGSDKEYHAAIEPQASGYRVTFAYGRRGSTLKTGVKIEGATIESARNVYTKLVNEKMAKGYIPSPLHTPAPAYTSPTGQTRKAESIPVALCEPIDAAGAERCIISDQWIAQEKYDGHRGLLRIASDATVTVQNRKGLTRSGVPTVWEKEMRQLAFDRVAEVDSTGEIVLDGEMIGERYVAFDLLMLDGKDTRTLDYQDRADLLADLFAKARPLSAITLAPRANTTDEKRALAARLTAEGAEGMVFKRRGKRYVGNRSDAQVKWKFWESATVLVIARNDTGAVLDGRGAAVPANKADGHRSIQTAMLDAQAGGLVFVGDVSVPPNYPMPTPGTFAEIKYLYAFRETRKMYQPQYLGTRDDVGLDDCAVTQLKYKQEIK